MSTKAERRPVDPRLEEFVDFLHPPIIPVPELEIGTLYGGVGGRLGRVGVYVGIHEINKSPSYHGYHKTPQGLFLTEETDLRKNADGSPTHESTYTRGTFFQPFKKLEVVPNDLPDQVFLAWLIEQDLLFVKSLQQILMDEKERFSELDVYQYELDTLGETIVVIRQSQSLIDS